MNDDILVTGEMLGLFFAFGFDTILIVAILWSIGLVSGTVALAVIAVTIAVFVGWISLRWTRLQSDDPGSHDADAAADAVATTSHRDSTEVLKERYAAGDLTEEEFEAEVERILVADDQDKEADRSVDRSK